jgi:pimeloyl-ACP methyl ester carboxylesterase
MMANLFFEETGKGQVVILLHGFPFHQGIWKSFAKKLSDSFHVYTVDLPGFGKSPSLDSPFTIDNVAEAVISWITDQKLKHSVLVGHSLGGYVALAAAKKNPALFSSLILFHSTAYSDTLERKQSRNKVLEFIDTNGVKAFTANFIGPLFADQDHPAVSLVRSIAEVSSTDAVKGYTQAMRDRSERTDVLRTFPGPVLFIGGDKDQGISVESIREQAAISPNAQVKILSNVAHLGMLENEKESLEIIRTYIEKVQLPGPPGLYKTL